jgi:hypothetical protein
MTRLSLLAAALGLLAAACGSSTNSPSPQQPVLTASLTAANEVPAPVGPEAAGTGTITITMSVTRDSGNNITAATASFTGNFSGFPPGTALTAAHIHPGAAGTTGSPIVNLSLSAGEIVFANGTGTLNKPNITVDPARAQAILDNPSNFYFNIHTAANPAGVARGQLARTQ